MRTHTCAEISIRDCSCSSWPSQGFTWQACVWVCLWWKADDQVMWLSQSIPLRALNTNIITVRACHLVVCVRSRTIRETGKKIGHLQSKPGDGKKKIQNHLLSFFIVGSPGSTVAWSPCQNNVVLAINSMASLQEMMILSRAIVISSVLITIKGQFQCTDELWV